MKKAPKIGQQVRYKGGLVVGPCTGTVTRIYPAYRWDEDLEKETWDLLPEREWSVALTVDSIPPKWCYGPDGKFAPEVSKLSAIRRRSLRGLMGLSARRSPKTARPQFDQDQAKQ